MWQCDRPTLVFGVCSGLLHLLLLGVAASIPISVASYEPRLLRVTVLQRAKPLPVQDVPGEIPEPVVAAPQEIVEKPKPRPPVVKKTPPVPSRVASQSPPKKVREIKKKPDPVPREKPPELTLPPPVSEPRSPSSEIPGVSPSAGESIIESDNSVSQHPQGAINNGDGAAAERVGRGTRQGNGAGNSARPDYQVNPKPLYPLIARRLGAQGEVLLRVRVREDGSVAEVELARSSGFALLDESATRTVRENWRFIPARLDGEPVESWVEVPIKFVLAGS